MVWQVANESSKEELLLNMGSAKDKHGVREGFFTREEWPFPDKGILINDHFYESQPIG